MNASDIIAALSLPAVARVDQRVPKTLLVQNVAPTAADKRQINDGIEGLDWIAALKPNTIGVPVYEEAERSYLELAVLSVSLRPKAKAARLAELVHRAVPHPVVLITEQSSLVTLSFAHKRKSQLETNAVVLDTDPIIVAVDSGLDAGILGPFLSALSLARQPRTDLRALYQGWLDTALSLQAASITGAFATVPTAEAATAQRTNLESYERIQRDLTALRSRAAHERQLSRLVDLNLQIKQLEAELATLTTNLKPEHTS